MSNLAQVAISLPSDREVQVTRMFNAPRRFVWEAWSKSQAFAALDARAEGWTMPVCEIDLRPGGAQRFVWRKTDGAEMEIRGVYKEIKPPEKLVSTENWGDNWRETLNTLFLLNQTAKRRRRLRFSTPPRKRATPLSDWHEGRHDPLLRPSR